MNDQEPLGFDVAQKMAWIVEDLAHVPPKDKEARLWVHLQRLTAHVLATERSVQDANWHAKVAYESWRIALSSKERDLATLSNTLSKAHAELAASKAREEKLRAALELAAPRFVNDQPCWCTGTTQTIDHSTRCMKVKAALEAK